MAQLHDRVGTEPKGAGYGYVAFPTGPFPHESWRRVLEASLARSRRCIAAVGAVDTRVVDRVVATLDRFSQTLSCVRPSPFLHDTTTRNVIVENGTLSGIVDVDSMCYGDSLLTIALTRTSLLDMRADVDYVTYWLERRVEPAPPGLLDLYSAIVCVDFLGELGQRFNRDEASPVRREDVTRRLRMLEMLLARIEGLARSS